MSALELAKTLGAPVAGLLMGATAMLLVLRAARDFDSGCGSIVWRATNTLIPSVLMQNLWDAYIRAGRPGGLSISTLRRSAFEHAVIGALLLGASGMLVFDLTSGALAAPLGLFLGPAYPLSRYSRMARARSADIRRSMPYFVDLLVFVLRAGGSLPLALDRAADHFSSRPIGMELDKMRREVSMGTTREDAMRALAERSDVEELREFVETTLQSERVGRPVADALESLSDRMRVKRLQQAEEKAGAAGVYVLVPSVVVFGVVVLLLLSPFIVKFIRGGYEGV